MSLPRWQQAFVREGLPCLTYPFQGEYLGRHYPDAYSAEQKAWLRRVNPGHGFTLDFLMDGRSPRGLSCLSGHRYFRAYPDGSVLRCSSAQGLPEARLGSIQDQLLSLDAVPRPCPADRCSCLPEIQLLRDAAHADAIPGA